MSLKSTASPSEQDILAATFDLRSIMDEIPLGVVLLDADRRIIWMNRPLEALTGFSQHEVVGVPCHHVMRHRVCLEGCPVREMDADSSPESVESDMINKDRIVVPVGIHFAPLRDRSGKLAGFLETVADLRPIREMVAETCLPYRFSDLIGRSPQMERVFQLLPVVAQNDSSILITGETGTGKDRVAEAIHQASGRVKGPFVKVNCGALPETLLESEIFGHQKGAFTGAVESRPGRFRMAHEGTLFLTEVGDLPLSLQVKLLTFLDDQVVYPLGGTKGFQADVRVIAATHRNLERMVREGRFREDLLYRLNVVRLHIPPLRERMGDVHLLMDHFLKSLNARLKKEIAGFSKRAHDILIGYPFPGNVRELQNIVEYAVNICQGTQILPHHLPGYLTDPQTEQPAFVEPVAESAPATLFSGSSVVASAGGDETWADLERRLILEALAKAGGKRTQAAETLGWGRSTLWRKMKQHGLLP